MPRVSANKAIKIQDAIDLKAATTLPATYGDWISAELDVDGIAKLKLLLVVSGSYDGTSIQLKGQVVEGVNYDEYQTDGTLDEQTLIVTADGNYSLEYQAPSFDRVRFLAKRTGGSQGNLQLSVLGG